MTNVAHVGYPSKHGGSLCRQNDRCIDFT